MKAGAPNSSLQSINTAWLEQREDNFKGRLRLFIDVGYIVYHEIELVRKFIPNDMFKNFAIRLRGGKVERTDLPCRQHTARAVPQAVR